MRHFLLKIFKNFVFCFIFLNAIAYLCLFILGKSTFYKPQFLKNGVNEKVFDYIVLGSSTGLTTLDTKLMDSITGKKGLNISMDDSGLPSHYLMLEYFYLLKKKTKCLVLAITPWEMANTNPILNDNDYRFLTAVNERCVFEYYFNFEKSNFKKLSFSRYLPLIGVSYFNTELFYPSILTAFKPNLRNRFDEKGNYCYPNLGIPKIKNYSSINLEEKNPYFFKIVTFCKKNNINLLLYQSPIFRTKIISKTNQSLINHSDIIKDPSLFYDNIHVNKKGRVLCSTLFARILLR